MRLRAIAALPRRWKQKSLWLAPLAAAWVFPLLAQAQNAAPQSIPWSYQGARGPDHWGDIQSDYATCKTGTDQSPIDIKNAQKAELGPIHFDYKLSPLRIVNNGYTVQINYESGSSITVNGAVYQLIQFHFHHPSETEIDGQKFDLELHLVHKNAEGRLAVVSVLMKSGSENAALRDLWTYLPREVGKETEKKKVQINAEDFLPSNRNYYTFSGSITIPPCTENADWYVMKTPVDISPLEINAFAKLYPNNARPVQPANGRTIEQSGLGQDTTH
jgi:carbonic anhydrase